MRPTTEDLNRADQVTITILGVSFTGTPAQLLSVLDQAAADLRAASGVQGLDR